MIHDERKLPFFMVQKHATRMIRETFDGRRIPIALAIYCGILEAANDFRDRHGENRLEAPRSVVARYAGVTPKALDDYVPDFVRLGLLAVEKRSADGVNLPNIWVILEPPAEPGGGNPACPPQAPPVARGSNPGLPGVGTGGGTSKEAQQEARQEHSVASAGALFAEPVRRPGHVVNRKKVTTEEWVAIEGIIGSFNEVFGTSFDPHAKDNASKIVMRLREGAPMDPAAHRVVHENNARAPWWGIEKPDTLGVLYSPKAWPRARACDGVPRTAAAKAAQSKATAAAMDRLANATDEELAAMGYRPGIGSISGGF